MADDVVAKLLTTVPLADEPPSGWETAPVLTEWSLVTDGREIRVDGKVYGSERWAEGEPIQTSALRAIDAAGRFITTKNTVYRLGKRMSCTTH